MNTPLIIGMVLFKNFTALDLFGPHEVFSWFPNAKVITISSSQTTVRSESGVQVLPDLTFDSAPQLDLLFVPGGSGINEILTDQKTLEFIKKQAQKAKYIVSVCTGALVLGASGLLEGYQATTHWGSMDFLKSFGAIPITKRFVVDRNRYTGGGVTAGIDLALKIAHDLYGSERAQEIQLMLEYDPKPEFKSGSPVTAPASVLKTVKSELDPLLKLRSEAVSKAKMKLESPL